MSLILPPIDMTNNEILASMADPLELVQILLLKLGANLTSEGLVIPLYTESFDLIRKNISEADDKYNFDLSDQVPIDQKRSFTFGNLTFKEIHLTKNEV